MAEKTIDTMLNSYIRDAHALEANVERMLDSMIATTTDPQIRQQLEMHKEETREHGRRLEQRLEARGAGTSAMKDVPAMLGAMLKGVADAVRSDKPGKNARDGFVTEHLEIASYELLERLANRAGDIETAEVARLNRADEEAMARKISQNWDRVLDLTLAEEGVAV